MSKSSTTVLIILDGWGHRTESEDNAIAHGKTPVWDDLWQNQPHGLISGSGLDVGLPDGQMGNSEVGHMNLGAGRIIHQDFTRITQSINTGEFYDNPVLGNAMAAVAGSGKALHLFGLLSPGGVHSHEDHITAAIDMARKHAIKRVYLHAFLDGRDVPPKSAETSIDKMHQHIQAGGEGGIASIVGRYYAMDRDNRWERVEPAYRLLVNGDAEYHYADPVTALHQAYKRGETDEFVLPCAIEIDGKPIQMENGDAVVFMNFRADRAREMSRAFTSLDFSEFDRIRVPELSAFVTLTEYASDIDAPVAFGAETIENSLGEYVAGLGLRQLRLAETEKYAHVTFFFSGGREEAFNNEERRLIPSPDVATYDLKPEMSAHELTDALVSAIESGHHDLIVCNYANGDMVGHTGVFDASVKAVETIDHCLGRIRGALAASGGQCLITADHGNVEQLVDHHTGQPHTAHTSELVPLVYIGPQAITLKPHGGVLSDVAPTLLALMGLDQPDEMTGRSLVQAPAKTATR
ncbi:MAG: 2,3-bisphosphoglycerate-independent phosphoglycerate mutase [Pseudomonadales bacterium]|nr:2,3-bisphosphoglycerate-independent phosphoglycerate mutase [Pseudomonadales bacterium]